MTLTTYVFDAYGTLFDVNSAARRLAERPDYAHLREVWPKLSEIWRSKQLQYSWLRTIMGEYCSFWQVTKDGLDFALEATGLSDDMELREELLALYWELAAFKEVPKMLATLKAQGAQTAILSNGSPDMLQAAVSSAGIEMFLDAVLSVETVGIFKPNSSVYQMVEDHFSCDRSQVLFVSSNGWDAAGAAGFGFQTAWVNRAGDPMDRLPHSPQHVLTDLTSIPTLARG